MEILLLISTYKIKKIATLCKFGMGTKGAVSEFVERTVNLSVREWYQFQPSNNVL